MGCTYFSKKCRIWLKRILIRCTWIFMFLFITYYCLIYFWNIICWKNYKTQKIYIPATNENLYLIAAQDRFDSCFDFAELSTCGWRIFNSSEHEYQFYEIFTDRPINTPIYYKVSNDTLYLFVTSSIPKPDKFRGKTKIIQMSLIDLLERFDLLYRDIDEKNELLESKGYCKFP